MVGRGQGYLGKFFSHENLPLLHFNLLAKKVIQDFTS